MTESVLRDLVVKRWDGAWHVRRCGDCVDLFVRDTRAEARLAATCQYLAEQANAQRGAHEPRRWTPTELEHIAEALRCEPTVAAIEVALAGAP